MTSSANYKSHYSVSRKLLCFPLIYNTIPDRFKLVLLLLEIDEDELKLLDSIVFVVQENSLEIR